MHAVDPTWGDAVHAVNDPSALTSADVGDQVLHALLSKELGEQTGPVGLNLNVGSLGEGNDVLGGALQAVVGQNQSLQAIAWYGLACGS